VNNIVAAVGQSSGEVPSSLEPVGALYPFVRHGLQSYIDLSDVRKFTRPESENLRYDTIQILYDEAWRGFGIELERDYNIKAKE